MPDGRISSNTAYGASVVTFLSGLSWNMVISLIGVAIALATYLTNLYFKRKETAWTKRIKELDEQERLLRIEKENLLVSGIKMRKEDVAPHHRKTDVIALDAPETLPDGGGGDVFRE